VRVSPAYLPMGCSSSEFYKTNAKKVDDWVAAFPTKEATTLKMIVDNSESKFGRLSDQDRTAINQTEVINQAAAEQLCKSELCGKLATKEENDLLDNYKKLNAAKPIKDQTLATNDLMAALTEILNQYKKELAAQEDLADVTFKGITDTNDDFQRIEPELKKAVAAADAGMAEEEAMEGRTKELAAQLARENQDLQHQLADAKMRDDRLARQYQKNIDEAAKLSGDHERLTTQLEEAGGVTAKHLMLTNAHSDTLRRHSELIAA